MSKDTGDINDPIEKSNEIDVIIFCDGYKERKGKCIGFSTENCEFELLPFVWRQHKIASLGTVNRNRQNQVNGCKRQNSSTNGPNLPGIRTAEEIGTNAKESIDQEESIDQ